MAPDAAADRAILVSADTVSLKLTLSAKLQKRPFSDAVLAPFCKAYNKKKGTDWTVDDLVSVCVDDELMTDYTVAASVVLLSGSTVSAALAFRVTRPEMQLNADPFSGESWSAPRGGEVEFIADEDDRSEVEKLKAERRAKRLAAEAEAAAAGDAAVPTVGAPAPAPPPSKPVEVADPASTAGASSAALAALDEAERATKALQARVAALEQVVSAALEGALQGAAIEDAKREVTDAVANVGRLVAALDEIGLGDVEDDGGRTAARARRKQAAATLEDSILPAAHALQRKLHRSTHPLSAPTAPAARSAAPISAPKQSAEIDSDED